MAATDRRKAPVIPPKAQRPVVPAKTGIQRRSHDGKARAMPAADPRGAALLAAALALPGVVSPAHAQTAPDQGVIGLRYFD